MALMEEKRRSLYETKAKWTIRMYLACQGPLGSVPPDEIKSIHPSAPHDQIRDMKLTFKWLGSWDAARARFKRFDSLRFRQ